jgi:hypothetical protein
MLKHDRHRQVDQHQAAVPPPGPCPAGNTLLSAAVNPTRSAHLRNSTTPACPTSPLPSAVTVRLWSHPLRLLTRRVHPFY